MDSPFLPVPVLVYAGLNILAFSVFTHDKLKAKMKGGRISETSLLFIAALGPFGALTAIVGFRHKTHHIKFILVPIFAFLHLLLFVWSWMSM